MEVPTPAAFAPQPIEGYAKATPLHSGLTGSWTTIGFAVVLGVRATGRRGRGEILAFDVVRLCAAAREIVHGTREAGERATVMSGRRRTLQVKAGERAARHRGQVRAAEVRALPLPGALRTRAGIFRTTHPRPADGRSRSRPAVEPQSRVVGRRQHRAAGAAARANRRAATRTATRRAARGGERRARAERRRRHRPGARESSRSCGRALERRFDRKPTRRFAACHDGISRA